VRNEGKFRVGGGRRYASMRPPSASGCLPLPPGADRAAGVSVAGEGDPGITNKANWAGWDARNCGLRTWDWGFEAVGVRDVKQTQLGGTGSRRARPALRDGRRNAGRPAGGPVAGAGEPGMSNKANLCVFEAENGVRREKPVAGAGEPGMSNKANLCVFEAENGVRREKRRQISEPGRQAIRVDASAIGKRVLAAATRSQQSRRSFCRRGRGPRNYKQSQLGGLGRSQLRIGDWGFEAAGVRDVKRTQLGGANGRWARPALRDGRRNAGRSGRPPVAGSRGPGMSNEPNLQRFWPENEGRCENEANFRPGAASDRHQCYSHRQAGACRRHVSRGRIVRNKANLKTEPGQWPEPCVRARLRLR